MKKSNAISGGPLNMDPRISEIFLAHLAVCCASTERASLAAARRRDRLFRQLSPTQQGYVHLVASAVGRCGS
jgi:hypothetical protein